MSTFILRKLLATFVIVLIGWLVGKLKWLGECDVAHTLSNATYYIFVPALLFRTTARIDLAAMPWGTLVAVFVPLVMMPLVAYARLRLRRSRTAPHCRPPYRRCGPSARCSATRCRSESRWRRRCSARRGSRSTWPS